MAKQLDVVVFGATGFTGKTILPDVYKLTKSNGKNLTWGVAGRSSIKLNMVLNETAKCIGVDDLSWVPVIIADVDDEESIKRMTRQARVIINCCGPYDLHGETVIRACLATGTHIVDVSGEMQYIEKTVLKYDQAARERGIYVVSACGMGCVPDDLGITFLENNFEGTVNSVEIYLKIENSNPRGSPPIVHYGTWESMVYTAGSLMEFISTQKQLKLKSSSTLLPKLQIRWLPFHRREGMNNWILPSLTSSRTIIRRSQRYFYENDKKRPIQTNCYMVVNSFKIFLMILFFGIIAVTFAQFNRGRKLLLKYPKLFSAGFFSHKKPTKESLMNSSVSYTFFGTGWNEKLSETTDQFKSRPNKLMITNVSFKNPGYGFTGVALTLAAIILLSEKEKLPKEGGVYSTAAAFSKTSYIKQLQENGANFEIISTKSL